MAARKPATPKLTQSQQCEINDILLKSGCRDREDEDFRFDFSDEHGFYIKPSHRHMVYKGEWELFDAACDNHVGYYENPVDAYLAGKAKFTIKPFADTSQFAAALKEIVQDISEIEWDDMDDDGYNELHSKAKRVLRAAPVKEPVKKPRAKKAAAK